MAGQDDAKGERGASESATQTLTIEERERAAGILGRETTRMRMLITLSLPVSLLLCIALGASMQISSLYVVSGGAVAGLLLWGLFISKVPLGPGTAGHRIFIAGDRSADDDDLMRRFTAASSGEDSSRPDNPQ